jgi:hypothetical protein
MLPRGQATCYGGPTRAGHPVFALVRMTRPERLQSYDAAEARTVRLVVNFAAKQRLEDIASCREKDGEIVCASTSCDGAVFVLREENDGSLRIKFDTEIPKAMWSCSDETLRRLRPSDSERYISVQRGTGSCIPPTWDGAD